MAAIAALEDLGVVSLATSEFVAAEVPVRDPWTGTSTPGGNEAVLLHEITHTDRLASLGAKS